MFPRPARGQKARSETGFSRVVYSLIDASTADRYDDGGFSGGSTPEEEYRYDRTYYQDPVNGGTYYVNPDGIRTYTTGER